MGKTIQKSMYINQLENDDWVELLKLLLSKEIDVEKISILKQYVDLGYVRVLLDGFGSVDVYDFHIEPIFFDKEVKSKDDLHAIFVKFMYQKLGNDYVINFAKNKYNMEC